MRPILTSLLGAIMTMWTLPALAQVVVDMPPPPATTASDDHESAESGKPAVDPAYRYADVGWVAINRYAGYRYAPFVTTAHGPSIYAQQYNRIYYGPPIGLYYPWGYCGYPFFGGVFRGVRFFPGHSHHGFKGHFGFHGSGVQVRIKF